MLTFDILNLKVYFINMSRPLRIEYPVALYHVMSHCAGKMRLYTKPEHFEEFNKILKDKIVRIENKL